MKTFPVCLFLCVSALPCAAQSSNPQPKIENVSDMKFVNVPNVPTCFRAAVEHGDPSSGPSTLLVKGTKGCEVPMHYHTPTEQVVMVSGTARIEMKGDRPRIMKAGGFATAPPRHAHHFTCTSACQFYVISDGVFDIHYVDDSGNEIPFEQAVKSLGKTASGPAY
jgi:quercetin dioxygenase-like cupin family protein